MSIWIFKLCGKSTALPLMLIFEPVLQDEAFPGDLKNNVFSCPEKETKINKKLSIKMPSFNF